MWSWWAWVSRIRAIGIPCSSAAATIPFAEPGIIVSITVSPSSSSTRKLLTKPKRLTREKGTAPS